MRDGDEEEICVEEQSMNTLHGLDQRSEKKSQKWIAGEVQMQDSQDESEKILQLLLTNFFHEELSLNSFD